MRITEEEFHEIYQRYYRLVMKVANRHVHDLEYSKDICQEVFLKFLEKLDKLDMDYCAEWLSVTAARKAIDFTRKAYNKHEALSGRCSEGEEAGDYMAQGCEARTKSPDSKTDLSHQLVVKEFAGKLFENLYQKNKGWYKLAIWLYVEHGTNEEISKELGISIENLRTRKHRMKKWILDNYLSEYDSLR